MAALNPSAHGTQAYSLNDIENRYGDWNVSKIRVARRPLVNELVGATLLGKYAQRKNPAHDQVFHSYLEFALSNPKTNEKRIIRVEKAENLHAYEVFGGREELTTKYEQALQVNGLVPEEPFWKYMERTRRRYDENGTDMEKYNLKTNNCQGFSENILKANGLYNERLHHDFVSQDADKIVPTVVNYFMGKFTNHLARKEVEKSGNYVQNIHANNLMDWEYNNPTMPWNEYIRRRGFSANSLHLLTDERGGGGAKRVIDVSRSGHPATDPLHPLYNGYQGVFSNEGGYLI